MSKASVWLFAGILVAVVMFVMVLLVQWIWNDAVSPLTGAGQASFWQAAGLWFLLSIPGSSSRVRTTNG